MTPTEALADGQLTEALRLQRQVSANDPSDRAHLFLFELQALAGNYRDAWATLNVISSEHADWPASRRGYRQLLRAAHQREQKLHQPHLLGTPATHARLRRKAVRAIRENQPDLAQRSIDRADRRTPNIVGHIDGREFDGLRDADDRFASVLELFIDGQYCWLAFEEVRKLTLLPADGWLEQGFRSARILGADGSKYVAVLPMIYPTSGADSFALGHETDMSNHHGPTCCIGAKLLFAGEEEVELKDVQQLELRKA